MLTLYIHNQSLSGNLSGARESYLVPRIHAHHVVVPVEERVAYSSGILDLCLLVAVGGSVAAWYSYM